MFSDKMAYLFIVSLALVSQALCLILPMTKPNGEADITSILNHVALLEQRVEKLEGQDIPALKAENQRLKSEIEQLQATPAVGSRGNITARTPEVSFTAELSSDTSFELHEVFKFGNVLDNKGGGFKAGSGIFSAPVAGTYIIWAHLLFVRSSPPFFNLSLRKEGLVVSKGYAETSDNMRRGVASINVYMDLKRGDQIWFTNDYGHALISGDQFSRYGALLISAH